MTAVVLSLFCSLYQLPLLLFVILFLIIVKLTGLRYEDILNEAQPAFQEALEYAPKEVVEGRTRRLKRAIDLSYKRKSLLDYVPEESIEDPFQEDIIPIMEKINKRNQEYVMYNMHNK